MAMRLSEITAGLNPEQCEAVTQESGRVPLLVLAGAGSGKTTVLVRRICALLEAGCSPEEMTALTFTRAAAREMEERVLALASKGEASRGEGLLVCTFHSLAYTILRSMGLLDARQVLDEAANRQLLAEIGRSLELGIPIETLENWAQAGKSNPAVAKSGRHSLGTARWKFLEMYQRVKSERNLIGFDELVPLACARLKEFANHLQRFQRRARHLLVDEFQDTSPDQLELLSLLYGKGGSLFLVGDDDQAIYGFRGADPRCMERLFEIHPNLKVVKLVTNYRSTASVLAYANELIGQKRAELRKTLRPWLKSEDPLHREDSPVLRRHFSTGVGELQWIAGDAEGLVREHGVSWSDICILVRLNIQVPAYRAGLCRLLGESSGSGVRIMTMHAAKGLEFPVVYVVGMEDGVCPYRHRGETLSPERQAEEKRLYYVAVTRARYFLRVTSASRRRVGGRWRTSEPSPFAKSPSKGFRRSFKRLRESFGRRMAC